jgi:hypothetical protein
MGLDCTAEAREVSALLTSRLCRLYGTLHDPTRPPSFLVMTIVAERGRLPAP